VLYLDTSAAVKMVNREEHTDALADFLAGAPTVRLISCGLIRTELRRALGGPSPEAEALLGSMGIVELSAGLLDAAGRLVPGSPLRSLDAIHLSAASSLGRSLQTVVTYDQRMAEAAAALGIPATTPV